MYFKTSCVIFDRMLKAIIFLYSWQEDLSILQLFLGNTDTSQRNFLWNQPFGKFIQRKVIMWLISVFRLFFPDSVCYQTFILPKIKALSIAFFITCSLLKIVYIYIYYLIYCIYFFDFLWAHNFLSVMRNAYQSQHTYRIKKIYIILVNYVSSTNWLRINKC